MNFIDELMTTGSNKRKRQHAGDWSCDYTFHMTKKGLHSVTVFFNANEYFKRVTSIEG